MTHFSNAAQFAEDPSLQPILAAALVHCAFDVLEEDPTTPDHEARRDLALRVLRSPRDPANVYRFAWVLSTNTTLVDRWLSGDTDGTQDDMPVAIESIWNLVAEVE